MEIESNFKEEYKMLEMMVFAVILVVAQMVAGAIMFVVGMKVMASKWFAKKYMEYFMKMLGNFQLLEKEEDEEEEL